MSTAGTRFTEIDWAGRPVRIEYRCIDAPAGAAPQPTLVFLHEGLGSVSMWRDFPDRLCAALGCAGLVYSRPAYGQSTPRPIDERWQPDFMHRQAREVLPAAAFDVVLAHFILAYVDRHTLLAQVREMLAPGGVLSLVTTTEEGGGPFFEGLDRFFLKSRNPLKRAMGRLCQRGIAQSHVPQSFASLEADIQAAGLVVLRRDTMRQPITFDNADEAYRFGIDEGWAANFLTTPGVPVRAGKALARWGTRQAIYPFAFTHVIEMLEIGIAPPSADRHTERVANLDAKGVG